MPLQPLPDPPGFVRRTLALGLGVPIASILFAFLLFINLIQMSSMLTLPFSRSLCRRINRWCANIWWGSCVIAVQKIYGYQLEITGDPVPMRESAIIISNHQQMPDIVLLMTFALSKGRLGDLKFFVKYAIKFVPGIGWGMVFLDCLFVRRNWSADRASIEATFDRIISDKVPLWLISFVEGTRIRPHKVEAARAFAEKRGMPPPEHVLIPRTKGFAATVTGLRSHVDAIYDLTLGYVDGVPTLWQYIKGFVPVAHIHVRRIAIADIPVAEDELGDWLLNRFQEKDALMKGFYANGRFEELSATE